LSIPETVVACLMPIGNLVWSLSCPHCREKCAAHATAVLPDMMRVVLERAAERHSDKPPSGHVH
jgi:hypothetical protein